jgi:hypothetical protein
LKGGFAEDEVKKRGVVRLHNEEEDLLDGDVKQLQTDNDMTRVAPDAGADEVRIPWDSRNNSNLASSAQCHAAVCLYKQ